MTDTLVEKRSVRRHKVLKGATIAFGGNGVECTVRNLSSRGAALDVANSARLPHSFVLLIGVRYRRRRARRRAPHAGV